MCGFNGYNDLTENANRNKPKKKDLIEGDVKMCPSANLNKYPIK